MQVMLGGADSPTIAQVAGVLFWGLFPAVTGMLTMRLLAEERGSGSIELLLTAPIRDWQVVFAKFVACFGFYLVLWLPTLLYVPVLADLHAQWHRRVHALRDRLPGRAGDHRSGKVSFFLDLGGWLTVGLGLLGAIARRGGRLSSLHARFAASPDANGGHRPRAHCDVLRWGDARRRRCSSRSASLYRAL